MSLRLHPSFALKALVAFVLSGTLPGCSGIPVKGREGTTHYLIIGIGVVSVPKPSGDDGVTASKIQALGIVANSSPNLRFTAGYIQGHTVSIRPDANVIVEQSDSIGGPLTISSIQARDEEK